MSDMYEKVSRPERRPRRRREIALGVALAAAVLAIGVWLLSVFGVLSVRPQFYQFVSALSASTVYAYENNTLRAEGNGRAVRVSGDNAYAIYQGMSAWTPTGLPGRPPAEEADLALDYGEGTSLQVWIWREKNGQPKDHGLSVRLETGSGERLVLEFGSASISPLERWTAADAVGNELWAE